MPMGNGEGTMRKLSALAAVLLVSACATTSEMPLAANVVRLDTQASGLLFVGAAPRITMKKAAGATIARGYTHFRFQDAATSQGREFAGMNTWQTGNAQASVYGNSIYASGSANTFSTPNYRSTSNIGVTVVMFHASDPAAVGAFEAATILKKS